MAIYLIHNLWKIYNYIYFYIIYPLFMENKKGLLCFGNKKGSKYYNSPYDKYFIPFYSKDTAE